MYIIDIFQPNLVMQRKRKCISGQMAEIRGMTIKTTEGEEKVYRFYELTSRKAYITINGNGGFYVLRNRVAKFVSDAQRFFALEMIDATGKN